MSGLSFYNNEELRQTMVGQELDPDKGMDCKKFAKMLENGEVGIPESLKGLGYSRNGKCEWYIWKNFVNYYRHGINFEMVSRIFEKPLPLNYKLYPEEYDENSTEAVRTEGSLDSKDKVVVKIDKNHYMVVKIDPEYTGSGKYLIITAFYVDKATADKARKELAKSGSKELFQALFRINEIDYDYFDSVPVYSGDMTKFSIIYSFFRNGEYSAIETANRMVQVDSSLSIRQADVIAHQWQFERNEDH